MCLLLFYEIKPYDPAYIASIERYKRTHPSSSVHILKELSIHVKCTNFGSHV